MSSTETMWRASPYPSQRVNHGGA
uniref:Uncharacterized protein n=1 Tax=Arundo donax TaxID=35708 RepID=A0A0A8ZBQ6_ARUDO